MSASNPRGLKRAGEPLHSVRIPLAPVIARAEGIQVVSNNSTTTYNFGRDVVNNNWVKNDIHLEHTALELETKQEKSMKTIKAALGDRFVHDALHITQPKDAGCMSGTRELVLAKFMAWIENDPTSIFWLAGMAGTGKTSIALTLCRMLNDDPSVVLGGTFFCSRSAGSISRTEPRRILPTLAASLAAQISDYATMLAAQLKVDDTIVHKPVDDQIVPLLVKPFTQLASITHPIVFVVDALDECSDERELSELITAIADFRSNAKVKFILTSRPEMHIRGTPISNPNHNAILHLHTISEEEVEADICRYIVGTLQIAAPYASWYSGRNIEALTRLSGGLFIFASTALKYILDPDNDEDRQQRLGKATSFSTNRTAAKTTMDNMYELVLTEACRDDKVDDDELEGIQRILACILSARAPLSVEALADLIGSTPLKLRGSLRRLHSLVYLPPSDVEPGLRTLHASFGDYILSTRAASHIRIATTLGDLALTRGCLCVMASRLHFNMSQIQSSHEPNPSTRPNCITLSLEYACLQWIYHVSAMPDASKFDKEIETAFLPRFLFWIEVIGILRRVSRAAAMLLFATSTFRFTELSRFLRDAHAFVASSGEVIEKSTPHIYLSALPFAPKDSLVYQSFAALCTGLIVVDTFGIDRHGGRLIMTLAGRAGSAICYSLDGHLFASGSEYGNVRIWDTRTGEETFFLLGDGVPVRTVAFTPDGLGLWVSSVEGDVGIWSLSDNHCAPRRLHHYTEIGWPVVFSPDGYLLASTQEDYNVYLWRAMTGQLLAVLRGHTSTVYAIEFSQHREILAAGALDGTIILWNISTGDHMGQITQDQAIRSLSFSPDSTSLASTSGGDIQIWEICAGAIVSTLRTLHGRWDHVISVEFSPDGASLVSVTHDSKLRLWILQKDATEASSIVLDGEFTAATFSPDGLYIASASRFDGTIQIWDASNGQRTVQPLPAHEDIICSVAVSPDSKLIVSGSKDQTVRVWDVQTGEPKIRPLLGHTDMVLSVDISPDGRLIASGSRDNTVRLWDAYAGLALWEPLRGHELEVNAVKFAPSGMWLASGSSDSSVRLWVVATGQPSEVGPMFCNKPVQTVAVSPDGRLLAAGDRSGRIHLWQAMTGQLLHKPFLAVLQEMISIAFSPTSAQVVCTGSRTETNVWDVSTGRMVFGLHDLTWQARSAAFSSNGKYIATCGSEGGSKTSVRLWSATTGTLLTTLRTHGDYVPHLNTQSSVVPTSDGRFIISCSQTTIRVWNLEAACSPSSTGYVVAALASTYLDHGWLLGPAGELLLWVPAAYRHYLQVSPCTNLIGQSRIVVTADESGTCAGDNWTACWRGNNLLDPI